MLREDGVERHEKQILHSYYIIFAIIYLRYYISNFRL